MGWSLPRSVLVGCRQRQSTRGSTLPKEFHCHPHDNRSHLVVVGDSSGTVSYFVVSEKIQEKRFRIKGIQLAVLQRPVLSIDLLAVAGRHLLMVGTTGGDIFCWDLPGDKDSINDLDDATERTIVAKAAHPTTTTTLPRPPMTLSSSNSTNLSHKSPSH